MLRIDFVTIFPRMFDPFLAEGVIARGIKQQLLDVKAWDLRDYTTDKHRSTDDEAYGGGPGMVMLAEPVLRCVEAIRETRSRVDGQGSRESHEQNHATAGGGRALDPRPSTLDPALDPRPSTLDPVPRVILTSPQGRTFTQNVAKELAGETWLVFLCGRYEGFDERIRETLRPDEISIGDFVVSGGELPAMLMADAIGRMVEGVVGNSGSVEEDSFFNGLLDYPHYTRPLELRGMKVPEILLSGHHEKIRKWRREQALRRTLELRPDLLENAELDEESREILRRIENETD